MTPAGAAGARAALCLAALLAGCGGPATPPPCAGAADDDPTVRALMLRMLGNPHLDETLQGELRLARQEAVRHCLQAHGMLPPGGVAPHRPPPLSHTLF